jgi:hypothetical protein
MVDGKHPVLPPNLAKHLVNFWRVGTRQTEVDKVGCTEDVGMTVEGRDLSARNY